MRIEVNGTPRDIAAATLADALAELGAQQRLAQGQSALGARERGDETALGGDQQQRMAGRGVAGGLGLLDAGRELLDLGEQGLLLLPLRLGDLLAEGLLLGAQALELAQRGAVARVDLLAAQLPAVDEVPA